MLAVYVRLLWRFRVLVVLAWVGIAMLGAFIMPLFMDNTSLRFPPQPHSPSYTATEAMRTEFPVQFDTQNLIVLLQRIGNSPPCVCASVVCCDSATRFALALNDSLADSPQHSRIVRHSQQFVQGYALFNDTKLAMLARNFVSKSGADTILVVSFLSDVGDSMRELIDGLVREWRPKLNDESIAIGYTGENAMFHDDLVETRRDMSQMDMIVLPVALIVLGIAVKQIKLLLVPVCTVPCSLALTMASCYPISMHMMFANFAPSVFISLVIAMSIDYSLFLLSRFREERLIMRSREESVIIMLRTAGKTISITSTTLAITFLGLVMFPTQFLSTLGLGSAVTLISVLVCNLTLAPVILLWADLISDSDVAAVHRGAPWWHQCLCCTSRNDSEASTADVNEIGIDGKRASTMDFAFVPADKVVYDELIGDDSAENHDAGSDECMVKSRWYRFASFIERHPLGVLVLVLALGAPISLQALQMNHTVNEELVLPRNAPSLRTLKEIKRNFPPGKVLPFSLLIEARPGWPSYNESIFSQRFFSTSQLLIETLMQHSGFPANSFLSVSWIDVLGKSQALSFETARQLMALPSDNELSASYRWVYGQTISTHHRAAIVRVLTPWDPAGDNAGPWVRQTRKLLRAFTSNASIPNAQQYEYHVYGIAADLVDAIDRVYEIFPWMVASTTAIIVLIVGVVFRSVMIPLRLIFTIGFTLTWIYGAGVLVFQKNIVDWLFPALRAVDQWYWMAPVMSFSILTGLTLDYDVFLVSRVHELHTCGTDTQSAIKQGVYFTGLIISSAGVIMIIAFSSLMLSQEMVLNQFGFLLCFGVLIDTFVTRPILVPSCMFLLGHLNWYPRR